MFSCQARNVPGWNGGFAPYGYRLVKGDDKSKGKLETVPEEKAVVQLVFDMFLNRNMEGLRSAAGMAW